ncbi:MAG: hypothetical protein N4A49_07220 [Marinifilaceae bacterium]|nr:hypothetical protein [Marinifilaceae bacterium]
MKINTLMTNTKLFINNKQYTNLIFYLQSSGNEIIRIEKIKIYRIHTFSKFRNKPKRIIEYKSNQKSM